MQVAPASGPAKRIHFALRRDRDGILPPCGDGTYYPAHDGVNAGFLSGRHSARLNGAVATVQTTSGVSAVSSGGRWYVGSWWMIRLYRDRFAVLGGGVAGVCARGRRQQRRHVSPSTASGWRQDDDKGSTSCLLTVTLFPLYRVISNHLGCDWRRRRDSNHAGSVGGAPRAASLRHADSRGEAGARSGDVGGFGRPGGLAWAVREGLAMPERQSPGQLVGGGQPDHDR